MKRSSSTGPASIRLRTIWPQLVRYTTVTISACYTTLCDMIAVLNTIPIKPLFV
jgi:hypothetical protein